MKLGFTSSPVSESEAVFMPLVDEPVDTSKSSSFFDSVFSGIGALTNAIGNSGLLGESPCHQACNAKYAFKKNERLACKNQCNAGVNPNPNFPGFRTPPQLPGDCTTESFFGLFDVDCQIAPFVKIALIGGAGFAAFKMFGK